MLNRIILIGRLTQDPELKYLPNGTAVCHFTLAVDRPRPNQNGEREADFINVVVWQKLGELAAQYLRKGRLAAVDGRLQIRSYENNQGQKVRVAEVVAENVRFLDRGNDDHSGASTGAGNQTNTGRSNQTGNQGFGGGQSGDFGGNSGGFGGFDDPFGNSGQPIDINSDDLPF